MPIVWSKASVGAKVFLSRDGGKAYEEIDGWRKARPVAITALIYRTVSGEESDNCMLKIKPVTGDPVFQGLFSIEEEIGGFGTKIELADIIRGLKVLAGILQ